MPHSAPSLSKRRVRFGQGIIEFERLLCRCFRRRKRFLRATRAVSRKKRIRVSQPRIGQGVLWILVDRLFEIVDSLSQIRAGALVPEISTLEIKFMSLGVLRRLGSDSIFLRAGELRLQRIGDRFRDLAFYRKDIG